MDEEKIAMEDSATSESTENEQKPLLDRIGEMPLFEGIRAGWKCIAGMKVKDFAMGIGICISLLLFCLLAYYVVVPLIELIWRICWQCISMPIGMRDYAYEYVLFDSDLFCTVPLCLCVASVVLISCRRHRMLCALSYFVLLQAILEIWDYWHFVSSGTSGVLGGACFAIMFIIIPGLLLGRKWFSGDRADEPVSEDSENG